MMAVRVLGAGVVGLSVAAELVRRGHRVTVVDPTPATGASHVAAGMLAPGAETWHGEEDLLRLGRASLALWPAFAADLGVPLRRDGTLLVGYDAGDAREVERRAELIAGLLAGAGAQRGPAPRPLTAAEAALAEPGLGRVAGAALLDEEASVDPRAVTRALLARVPVVATADLDPVQRPDVTVIATGAVLPAPHRRLVRGVRGEILRLRLPTDELPSRTVRGWVAGQASYLVPRGDGELVVGATTEEHDTPPVVTAGGVLRLLAAARVLWPALDRAELVEAAARDRPATVDGLPLVGPTHEPGVLLAAGHHRHGVLLAPLTAQLIADHVETGVVDPVLDPRRLAPHAHQEAR